MHSEDDQYSLGGISGTSNFNFAIDLTLDEFERIVTALGAVSELQAPFHYQLIERNFVDVQSVHQFVAITLSLGRRFASPDRKQVAGSVMTSIVNWLTSMRLFLDHEETDLKRKFGKESSMIERFKKATSRAFDDQIGYRFATKLRNYVQHCGLPLSRLEVSRRPGNVLPLQIARLLVDRDKLLADYNEWGQFVTRDLRSMSSTFELLPLLEGAMTGIRGVYRECAYIRLDHALTYVPTFRFILQKVEKIKSCEQVALFRYRIVDDGGMRISPQLVPVDVIRTLVTMVSEGKPRDSLWPAPGPEVKPSFDPSVVRERFHRDNRGVQAVAAFLHEGGGTPAFMSAIRQMIADDRDVEPLISGLINVSALLVAIAGATLGTSAEGLVGGLLDEYSSVDLP
ncbi:hypothetical protein AB0L41_32720 [Amycolatopsis mediterranei]|uniref:hypothetical protein n=1 Tax=Amycolatopsis mediterranei TaxID=33910 RepID=UPI0034187220